jgi:hypothetical protein
MIGLSLSSVSKHNMWSYLLCLLTDDNDNSIIIRPHIVFTDRRHKTKTNKTKDTTQKIDKICNAVPSKEIKNEPLAKGKHSTLLIRYIYLQVIFRVLLISCMYLRIQEIKSILNVLYHNQSNGSKCVKRGPQQRNKE